MFHEELTVGTTATQITPATAGKSPGAAGAEWFFTVPAGSTFFLGGSTVTNAGGAAEGVRLPANTFVKGKFSEGEAYLAADVSVDVVIGFSGI